MLLETKLDDLEQYTRMFNPQVTLLCISLKSES